MLLKILLSGDGGQGIQLISETICRSAFERGWFVTSIPNYGLEQRGGVSLSFVQISDKEISYPKFIGPDILLIMSDQARSRVANYAISAKNLFDMKDCANREEFLKIKNKSANVFFLSAIVRFLKQNGVDIEKESLEFVTKKLENKPGFEDNMFAFQIGKNFDLCAE